RRELEFVVQHCAAYPFSLRNMDNSPDGGIWPWRLKNKTWTIPPRRSKPSWQWPCLLLSWEHSGRNSSVERPWPTKTSGTDPHAWWEDALRSPLRTAVATPCACVNPMTGCLDVGCMFRPLLPRTLPRAIKQRRRGLISDAVAIGRVFQEQP